MSTVTFPNFSQIFFFKLDRQSSAFPAFLRLHYCNGSILQHIAKAPDPDGVAPGTSRTAACLECWQLFIADHVTASTRVSSKSSQLTVEEEVESGGS